METEAQFPAERDESWEMCDVERNSSGVFEIHGAWINDELIEGFLIFTEGSPVQDGDGVPFPKTNPAVSWEESASGGALWGKHAIRQVVLTEHLVLDWI